jgi:hypothetical protein
LIHSGICLVASCNDLCTALKSVLPFSISATKKSFNRYIIALNLTKLFSSWLTIDKSFCSNWSALHYFFFFWGVSFKDVNRHFTKRTKIWYLRETEQLIVIMCKFFYWNPIIDSSFISTLHPKFTDYYRTKCYQNPAVATKQIERIKKIARVASILVNTAFTIEHFWLKIIFCILGEICCGSNAIHSTTCYTTKGSMS